MRHTVQRKRKRIRWEETAVNRQDGRIIWQFQPQTIAARHVGSRTSFVAHDDVLYYATIEDKHLYGVDRHTGEKVWEMVADGWLYGPFPGMNDMALVIEFPYQIRGYRRVWFYMVFPYQHVNSSGLMKPLPACPGLTKVWSIWEEWTVLCMVWTCVAAMLSGN